MNPSFRAERLQAGCLCPETDVMRPVQTMNRTGNIVAEEGRLDGMPALEDLLGFFALQDGIEGRRGVIVGGGMRS